MRQPRYSPRVDEALAFVAAAFRFETRKGSNTPYVSHLLQVAVWVAEHHGSEEQIIAALLHDYLEDIEGADPEEVEARFGATVRGWVELLSDTTRHPKPPWRARKEDHVERLRTAPPEVKLIAACDKLHNARCLVRDVQREGEAAFLRFNAGMADVLWYYQAMAEALATAWSHAVLDDLRAAIADVHGALGRAI